MSSFLDLTRKLCGIPGVSGCEEEVREAISEIAGMHCGDIKTDALGNLLVFKEGRKRPQNTLMFSAHMDEVGFIVTGIEKDGLLRFENVGGIDSRVIIGKGVEVGRERIPGVIGSKAVHLQSDKEKGEVPDLESVFIDIGASCAEEAGKYVSPGERAVFYSPFLSLGKKLIMGRALDNRAGCALLLELICRDLPFDCHFAFTVQEETGSAGALTAANAVRPDIGVVVEATTAADIAGVPDGRTVCRLGRGPVISFMDKASVYDRELYRLAFDTAKRSGLRCQPKQMVAGGNDARSIQTAGGGARVIAVSLPCRYIHSPSAVLNTEDARETLNFLAAFIEELGDNS